MYLYFIYLYKLIDKIVMNQVISYWRSYGSSVCCIGPIQQSLEAEGRGPIQPTEDL